MFGLHHFMTPIHIELINQTGMTVLLPILAQAGAGQVGAALAIWLKCRKNKPLVGIVKGGLPSGILGIGEPLIYGVTLLWQTFPHCLPGCRCRRCVHCLLW